MHFVKKDTTHFGILFCHSWYYCRYGEGISVTNALWTDEKSRFLVETIKAMMATETHFEEFSCNAFCTLISNNPKLLQEIRSSAKYKTSAQKERTTA
jgi:methyl coenzyme M reductase beta subunit